VADRYRQIEPGLASWPVAVPDTAAPCPAAEAVAGWLTILPLPRTLAEAGVARAAPPACARMAAADLALMTSPRPVTSADEIEAIFIRAFDPQAR